MPADTTNQPSPNPGTDTGGQGDAVSKQLAEFGEQLRQMNEQMIATQTAIVESTRRAQPPKQEIEEDLYNPKNLLAKADEVFTRKLQAERAKDMAIYNLAQEYPEIQTSKEIRQAVLEAQRALPEGMRDTAEGYEMAVLKAVTKGGLIPKSKRQAVDEDVSLQPRGGNRPITNKKTKVAPETLELAELMGMNIDDPKVVERLEAHAQRNFTKYR